MNYFRIKTLVSVVTFILAPWGGGPYVKAAAIAPTGPPIPVFKTIQPLTDAPQSLQTISYAPFSFSPMGTYANSFASANCTWGAASMEHIPWSGNANAWDDNARAAGYTVSDVPIIGAIAQTDRGAYGHVAVVTKIDAFGVWITEMNYDNNGGVRTRIVAPGEFVYIYI